MQTKNYYQCIELKLLYKRLKMKKSIRTLLFLSIFVVQLQNVFANDIYINNPDLVQQIRTKMYYKII